MMNTTCIPHTHFVRRCTPVALAMIAWQLTFMNVQTPAVIKCTCTAKEDPFMHASCSHPMRCTYQQKCLLFLEFVLRNTQQQLQHSQAWPDPVISLMHD